MLLNKKNQFEKRSHHFLRFHEYWVIELCIALLLFFLLKRSFPFPIPWIVAWDGFALTSILLTWLFIFTKDPYSIRRQLRLTDTARRFFLFIVISAAIASVLSTWFLLRLVKEKSIPHVSESITFALITIAISWTFVHTRFASLYAHFFYRTTPSHLSNTDQNEKDNLTGGLIFPGQEKFPDYWDFVYFSFVIGMTCQVADVGIAKHRLRRLVLLHGLLSFLFNTSIIALVVNIISGLL
ncbi:MAG: DUF1345 domain-containing protein [Verrucomicrobia bacterium]|nr:DUF1345 domain-containing protein [Verrucomicrobiota bacterium]